MLSNLVILSTKELGDKPLFPPPPPPLLPLLPLSRTSTQGSPLSKRKCPLNRDVFSLKVAEELFQFGPKFSSFEWRCLSTKDVLKRSFKNVAQVFGNKFGFTKLLRNRAPSLKTNNGNGMFRSEIEARTGRHIPPNTLRGIQGRKTNVPQFELHGQLFHIQKFCVNESR